MDLPGAVEQLALFPTPRATDPGSAHSAAGEGFSPQLGQVVRLLPTPATTDRFGANRPNTRGGSDALRTVACFELADRDLLRSPTLSDVKTPDRSGQRAAKGHQTNLSDQIESLRHQQDWGKYEAAVRQWEELTRPAPAPTEPNRNGAPRLNAEFSEWMMGWPEGWVTDLINPEPRKKVEGTISRSAALKMIGNGVVPQQAAAALRILLASLDTEQEDK